MKSPPQEQENEHLTSSLRIFIADVQRKIISEQARISELYDSFAKQRILSPVDIEVRAGLEKRKGELGRAYSSPFFSKCVLVNGESGESQTLFFGKQQVSSENIYSWTAPIASIRFENPGTVTYNRPSGEVVTAKLTDKEQYMIVEGKVIFYAKESEDVARKLIHHDYFSSRKGVFELPEIVAIMEKAQDAVIRAHHIGPFAISGPAGSGKTTLSFHRIAYLLQSPDTTQLFPERTVIIFVQDSGTKDYFSHLLPNLGINNIKITTFIEWAFEILQLTETQFVSSIGKDDAQKTNYEYEKIKILRSNLGEKYTPNIFSLLQKTYEKHLSGEFSDLFSKQKKERILDRIDITIALQIFFNTYGKFEITRKFNVMGKNGEIQQKKEKKLLNYSLMLIDEFQNYLPEQLSLLNKCVTKETQSVIYVGDIRQQIRLGTIRSFEQIGEKIDEERNIVLHKVYRNTKQILQYIGELGYKVEIPANIKEGPEVVEIITNSDEETLRYVEDLITRNPDKNIGIIGNLPEDILKLKIKLGEQRQVHISTIIEAQGIEFDVVCIVGSWKNLSQESAQLSSLELAQEKERIHQDLLYVALTRAIDEMHIIGDIYLKEVLRLS